MQKAIILTDSIKKILRSIKQNKILYAILLLAILLRFIGIYPGYHPYHSDEGMSYSSAIEMIRNLNIDPTRYDYPSLVPLINAFLYVIFFIPAFIIQHLIFDPELLPTRGKNLVELWQQVVIQNQQIVVLFWGRYVTALFGVGVVLLTYIVGKRYFEDKRIALAAAFLTAVNFRQVLNSHLGLPDIYNAFFMLLALWVFYLLMKTPNLKNYLLSGIVLALYFSVKFQIFVFPAFILVHLFIVFKKPGKKNLLVLIKRFFSKNFVISCIIFPIVVLAINPYHLIKFQEFQAVNSYTALKYSIGIKTLNFYPVYYLFKIGIGEIISISFLAGILVSLRKKTFNSLLLLTIVLSFFYVFLYYTKGGFYVRNFVTITPLVLIFACVSIVMLVDFIFKKRTISNIAILFLISFVSFPMIKNSAVSSYFLAEPWGFKEANVWAKANIPEKAKIVSHPWDNYPRDMGYEIIPFEVSEIFSLAEMREDDADFGFLNMDWITLSSYWWMNMDWAHFLKFKGGRPDDILNNSFSATAAQEMASYSVAKFVSPWQAPNMNFLIVKVPSLLEFEKSEKITFSFNTEQEFSLWKIIMVRGDTKRIIFDDKIGNLKPGTLKIQPGISSYPVFMAKSAPIKVEEGKAYLIEGWIKTSDTLIKKTRDGFLRVDFYMEEPKYNLEDRSIYGSVSKRIYGDPIWHKVEILTFASGGARFMTIGAQANNYSEFWFDDIKVYESMEKINNPVKSSPYLDYRIPDDILFPYSQGGM